MSKIPIDIISACKQGDRAAQKQLYLLSKDRLKAIAIRYCSTTEDAKDVVQEGYLKIFRSIDMYDAQKGQFESWSTRIIVNEAYMLIRRKHNFNNYKEAVNQSEVVDNSSMNKMTLSEVYNCLDKLKIDHKLVLNMFFFEQYSYTEMAELLTLKESSVRSKVSRAKAELISIWSRQNEINYEYK